MRLRAALWLLLAACTGESPEAAERHLGERAATVQASVEARRIAEARRPCPDFDARISAEAIAAHLRAFDDIARRHGDNRATFSEGYAASVAYVRSQLDQAEQPSSTMTFVIPRAKKLGPGALEITAPAERRFAAERDFTTLGGSPRGDVRAPLVAIDVTTGPTSTSGCEAADFEQDGEHLVRGKVALMRRGTCPFADKVRLAQEAGAVAVIVFNEGTPQRRGLMQGTLLVDPPAELSIPALFTTSGVGAVLQAAAAEGEVEVRVAADTELIMATTENVFAEVEGEVADVFMVGAHLDSVDEGPGVNDNASGVAAVLELARQLSRCETRRSVRFAWWGGEELGLRGSKAYVRAIADAIDVAAYVNLDMIGATNHVFAIGDGDGSRSKAPGPGASGELEAFFHADFTAQRLALIDVPFYFRSDYAPFHRAGIAVADLTAGYDAPKSSYQARLFGGTAGKPPDPCYHKPCDDLSNVDADTVTIIARAVARAVAHFAIRGEGLDGPPAAPHNPL